VDKETMLRIIKQDDDFNRLFNRELITLVIPIALQNLISAVVISADVVLLGKVSQAAMSAVSLAGMVTFVLTLFYFGLATGVGILAAQYWGKKDLKAIQYVLNISLIFSFAISILFFVLSMWFPETLMRIFTDDGELIRYGTIFLRPVSFSYLAMSFSQMYLSAVKSMEKARLSATISSSALVLTILFDAIVVFVLFPDMPEKAVFGVAMATVTARFIELLLCFVHSLKSGEIQFKLPGRDFIERTLLQDYLKYTSPVQANYLVWGGALTATATIIGHVNADMVAANSIASAVKNLAVVLCTGIAGGGAVLIGKYLGNNDLEIARKAGNRINLYALIFGILAGVMILLTRPFVLNMVELIPTAHAYLDAMLYICAYYVVGKSLNSTNIGGIFPAGGDPKFGFWMDTIVMWGIILPLSYLSAFVWKLDPITLYVVISLDEIVKLPAALIRYRQYKWLKNITRELAPAH
jgi:putative MATE family efflux protein